jgi:hypothetical protein
MGFSFFFFFFFWNLLPAQMMACYSKRSDWNIPNPRPHDRGYLRALPLARPCPFWPIQCLGCGFIVVA